MIKCVFSNNVGWILTEKNYAEDWMNLSYEEKKDAAILAFKNNIKKLLPEADLNSMVENYEKSTFFDLFIEKISFRYRETGLKKHHDVACHNLVAEIISRLKKEAIQLEQDKLNDGKNQGYYT